MNVVVIGSHVTTCHPLVYLPTCVRHFEIIKQSTWPWHFQTFTFVDCIIYTVALKLLVSEIASLHSSNSTERAR